MERSATLGLEIRGSIQVAQLFRNNYFYLRPIGSWEINFRILDCLVGCQADDSFIVPGGSLFAHWHQKTVKFDSLIVCKGCALSEEVS